MSYDLLIKNGTVVDGTGAPPYRADVAIANGRIAEIGNIADEAKTVIDASDLLVAPGFIDPHTHYDAQICWDPLITSSSWHGVTSLVMGNCGVGIAPCKPEVREIAAWDLVNVEGIPFAVLTKGITWEWETFPEYMNAAEKRGCGTNLGFLAPLTPFRHFVMGAESMEHILVWAPENFIEYIAPRPLLIVTNGAYDLYHPLDHIQIAFRKAGEPKRLEILPHDVVGLYVQPGLGEAMGYAIEWFDRYLRNERLLG